MPDRELILAEALFIHSAIATWTTMDAVCFDHASALCMKKKR
jgi:hypothetical protein